MLKAHTQNYYIQESRIGQIVFVYTTAGGEFRMTLDVVPDLFQKLTEMQNSMESLSPYTLEILNSDICINYTGGSGSVLFASGGENHDMIWCLQQPEQMLMCLNKLLASDIWLYVKPIESSYIPSATEIKKRLNLWSWFRHD